ncbi:MAG: 3D-(3,5/4)-trihydroxycyclohexane-1,2-dione acylhydrolase (decyclizing) [Armatimonadota bacterium]|nr:3D-(3,5/4)-trihydroxycyclohexane-1,2-dione acylhydrolase (decyclizing) [Armatimonadota bacterium]MDR5697422.1 3D-(3,5/4)-trihydroxycyclohexane-1,2-dione acylhydrolase (decyclizing) [Armatimonadota bacterium]
MKTRRLTMAQALVAFLAAQHVERDGRQIPFFAGVWGILGHGNVAGIGQALQEFPQLRLFTARNEQAMVHAASAFAKMHNRLRAFACTSSIGPGATNMVTGAAAATINRLPVLLLPGDAFARRNVGPVLQQLESPWSQDVSVNDCFRPVSRYWDRIDRPDQLPSALMEAMRVLTSPADVGAVTLALPQDVQAEAWDYPEALFERRVWQIARSRPDAALLRRAAEWIRAARRPLIVAGGGVLYSEAHEALADFASRSGVPVAETQAGKGSLPYDHPQNLGAIGVTGSSAANITAREADLVLAIGTRLTDFTTASKTAFQHPDVRFVNINVCELDAHKHAALPLVADARVALGELAAALADHRIGDDYAAQIAGLRREWHQEVERLTTRRHGPPLSQARVIGIVNAFSRPQDVVVCAAGSLPGDLHKLWRTRDPKGYHLEYGYSCMGYEIAGGLGVKMADPRRDVYVMVGDGSYLMMSSEIVTSIQEGYKLTILLLDNHGFSSIGGLSRVVGSGGFGTEMRLRNLQTGQLDGDILALDFVASAKGLGAHAVRAVTEEDLQAALEESRRQDRTTVIVVEVDGTDRVPAYESWWDVPVAETSQMRTVQEARAAYEENRSKERFWP